MKFNEDLASIHAYLCADGYVIKNPPSQSHKYYYIGLRNTCPELLLDFQKKFYNYFGHTPIITKDGRAKIQNKQIYELLTKKFVYYSANWNPPTLGKRLLKSWLRSYFDCDGWVSSIKAKDRKVGLASINYAGLIWIQKILMSRFNISSTVHRHANRNIFNLTICGKDDLIRFQRNIDFLHPKKTKKLQEAIFSYVDYRWEVPCERKSLHNFILSKGKFSKKRGQIRFNSILRKNLLTLKKALGQFRLRATVSDRQINGNGNVYYTLSIRLSEMEKLK